MPGSNQVVQGRLQTDRWCPRLCCGQRRLCKGRHACRSHIPPDFVVRGITAQRNPPEVRICRLALQPHLAENLL